MRLYELFEAINERNDNAYEDYAFNTYANFLGAAEALIAAAKKEGISKIPMDKFVEIIKNTGISEFDYEVFKQLMNKYPALENYFKNYSEDFVELDIGQEDVETDINDLEQSEKAVEKIAKRVAKRRLKK